MALSSSTLVLAFVALLLCLAITSSVTYAEAGESTEQRRLPQIRRYCVAKPRAPPSALQNNIDYICEQYDCSVLDAGGVCHEPTTLRLHASVAYHIWFLKHGRNPTACVNFDWAMLTDVDPSYGHCDFSYL